MNYVNKPNYHCYNGTYIGFAVRKDDGKIAYLGIDAGGRDEFRKNTYNLLKPGFGAWVPSFAKKGVQPTVEATESQITTVAGVEKLIVTPKEKTISIDLSTTGNAFRGSILECCLAIEVAPPSIWAKTNFPKADEKPLRTSKNPLVHAERNYQLPMYIHFPDYGTVKIEAEGAPVYCHEELTRSAEMNGLCLGLLNHGGHVPERQLHSGYSKLSFKLRKATDKVTLKLTVLEEQYPKINGIDFSDSAWNGFKRCWLNNFTINRQTCSMGDNIYLHGMSHLVMHNRADTLYVMDPKDEITKLIRSVFEYTLDTSWERGQAEDGEVNMAYFDKCKKEGPCAGFIDSTPAAIISSCVIAKWKPSHAKKNIDKMLHACDFLMGLDCDGDGIVELPFSGNSMDAEYPHKGARPRIWWDNFGCGHKDIFFNCLSHRALRGTEKLARKLGRVEGADKIAAFLEKTHKNFFNTFYNPETGVMAGWISADGNVHDYMFTYATANSIDEGLVDKEQGRKMMEILLAKLDEQGFGSYRYGVPGPVIPVDTSKDTFGGFMGDWPLYENGGLCGMTAYHFINALCYVGLKDKAEFILKTMLNTFDKGLTHSGLMPGYTHSIDWRTKDGVACGYNYLADNYLFLLSLSTGIAGNKHPGVVR